MINIFHELHSHLVTNLRKPVSKWLLLLLFLVISAEVSKKKGPPLSAKRACADGVAGAQAQGAQLGDVHGLIWFSARDITWL